MRIAAVATVAALAVSTIALAACSDDASTPDPVADASTDAPPTGPDAAKDAAVDVQGDASTDPDGALACTAATVANDPPTDLCSPLGQCSDCATPGSVRYLCQSAPYGAPSTIAADASAPLEGCKRIYRSPENLNSQYCCPPAWVRHNAAIVQYETCKNVARPSLYVAPLGSEATMPAGCDLAAMLPGQTMLRACCAAQ